MPLSTPKSPAAATPKRRRGPRPKHVPRRTCVACREQDAKRSLTRIVRTPGGEVVIDRSGKQNGRGAYLCDRPACWERAISGNVLSRALNVDLTAETLQRLREFAAELPGEDSTPAEAAAVSTTESSP